MGRESREIERVNTIVNSGKQLNDSKGLVFFNGYFEEQEACEADAVSGSAEL